MERKSSLTCETELDFLPHLGQVSSPFTSILQRGQNSFGRVYSPQSQRQKYASFLQAGHSLSPISTSISPIFPFMEVEYSEADTMFRVIPPALLIGKSI